MDLLRQAEPLIVAATLAIAVLSSRPSARLWARLKRRQAMSRVVRNLACGVNLSDFEDKLEVRPQLSREHAPYIDHIFVLPDAYVQAVTDDRGVVRRWTVTARTKRFRPHHANPTRTITLNRSKLVDVDDEGPTQMVAWAGARRGGLAEWHWYGNPGRYEHFLYAFNDAGSQSFPVGLEHVHELECTCKERHGPLLAREICSCLHDNRLIAAMRTTTVVTTFGCEQSTDWPIPEAIPIGPDLDAVRSCDGSPHRWSAARYRFYQRFQQWKYHRRSRRRDLFEDHIG